MTSTRTIRRLIGSAAIATATAGITIATNAIVAAPAPSAYPLCETVTVSTATSSRTVGDCLNSGLPTLCLTPGATVASDNVDADICVVD